MEHLFLLSFQFDSLYVESVLVTVACSLSNSLIAALN